MRKNCHSQTAKVKRELARIYNKTLGAIWDRTLSTYAYDLTAPARRRIIEGTRKINGEAAIYLIYPVDGLKESHLNAVKELCAHNIDTVVVSNSFLSERDIERLLPLCCAVIQRPNAGYDFGGYRDAVLYLGDELPKLERLYILNDSVWMVEAAKSWFDMVREKDVDFCGASHDFAHDWRDSDRYDRTSWLYGPEEEGFHYGSYALAIAAPILRDPQFLTFWKRYHLSQDKDRTIKNGEVGLTRWVLDRGYSHAATCPTYGLDRELDKLSDADIDLIFHNTIIPKCSNLDERQRLALEQSDGKTDRRAKQLSFILSAVSAYSLAYAEPFYILRYRGFQFVKKSPVKMTQRAADIIVNILEQMPGPQSQQAAKEARSTHARTWVCNDPGPSGSS